MSSKIAGGVGEDVCSTFPNQLTGTSKYRTEFAVRPDLTSSSGYLDRQDSDSALSTRDGRCHVGPDRYSSALHDALVADYW